MRTNQAYKPTTASCRRSACACVGAVDGWFGRSGSGLEVPLDSKSGRGMSELSTGAGGAALIKRYAHNVLL
jgi:hypothetical protein